MGAIVLDASKVNSYVLPNLNKSKTSMQEAYSTGQSLRNSLPSSFNYRSTVNEIVSQIYNIQKEISDIDTMISKKIDKAKTIENKASSKVSSIASSIGSVAGGITGAAVGNAIGGIVGAAAGTVAGAVVGSKIGSTAGKTIVDTGAKVVGGFVSGAKKIVTNVVDFFKDTGAKIVDGVKSIWKKFTGTIKNLGSKVVNATKKVGKAIYNTGAKIVDGATKAVKGIWDGIKNFGKSIWDGCKKVAKKTNAFVNEKVFPALKKFCSIVCEGVKWVGSLGASIVNVAVSLVEGLVSFVEALVDAVVLIIGGLFGSIGGIIVDFAQGISGNGWDFSATGAVWKKGLLPFVGTNYTDKLIFQHYDGTFFDKYSFDWAKRDGGIVYEIGKGVGYYVGVIVASVFTAGVAGAAGGVAGGFVSTFANGVVAGTAELGKATQSNYNAVIDKETKSYYINETLKNYPELTLEEATQIVEYNLENNVYENYKSIRKNQQDNISTSNVLKLMAASGSQAVVEGVTISLLRDSHKMAKVVGKSLGNVKAVGKGVVQFAKAFVKEGTTVIVDDDYNTEKAIIDGTSAAITEVIAGNFKASDITSKATSALKKSKLGQTISNSNLYTNSKNVIGNVKSKISTLFSKNKAEILRANSKGGMEDVNQFSDLADDVDQSKLSKFFEKVKEYSKAGKDNLKKETSSSGKFKYGIKGMILDKATKDSEKTIIKEGVINPVVDAVVS